MTFEDLYQRYERAMERLIFYRVGNYHDALDVIGEARFAAYRAFTGGQLHDKEKFGPWLMAIARNACNRYYSRRTQWEPLEAYPALSVPEPEISDIRQTLQAMREKDGQLIRLYYIEGYRIEEIARMLHIPIGTVKSRLHAARIKFRERYPYPKEAEKGKIQMHKGFPKQLPQIQVRPINEPPFALRITELPGYLVPVELGAKSRFAFYDDPSRELTGVYTMEVLRKARIHDVDCLMIDVEQNDCPDGVTKRTIFARRTDTHVQYVADAHIEGEAYVFSSFLDPEWIERWSVGEDNCGREIELARRGYFTEEKPGRIEAARLDTPDVLGRYAVTVCGNEYDTVCVIDDVSDGILVMQYFNREGRTVAFRRYNRDDWKVGERYTQSWSERFPGGEQVTVNGQLFVHWYDCVSEAFV